MGKKDNKKRRHIIRAILIVSIVFLLALTSSYFTRLLVLGIFIMANLGLALGKRLLPRMSLNKYLFGIELVMFCTVLSGMAYGAFTGALMGGILMSINYVGERRFSRYFPITIASYALVGYIASFFRGYGAAATGISMTIAYNLIINLALIPFISDRKALAVFSIINLIFNVSLFFSWGDLIYSLVLA